MRVENCWEIISTDFRDKKMMNKTNQKCKFVCFYLQPVIKKVTVNIQTEVQFLFTP